MCNAIRSLALGDPDLDLDHTSDYWVALSLTWSAAIVLVLAPITVLLYRRAS